MTLFPIRSMVRFLVCGLFLAVAMPVRGEKLTLKQLFGVEFSGKANDFPSDIDQFESPAKALKKLEKWLQNSPENREKWRELTKALTPLGEEAAKRIKPDIHFDFTLNIPNFRELRALGRGLSLLAIEKINRGAVDEGIGHLRFAVALATNLMAFENQPLISAMVAVSIYNIATTTGLGLIHESKTLIKKDSVRLAFFKALSEWPILPNGLPQAMDAEFTSLEKELRAGPGKSPTGDYPQYAGTMDQKVIDHGLIEMKKFYALCKKLYVLSDTAKAMKGIEMGHRSLETTGGGIFESFLSLMACPNQQRALRQYLEMATKGRTLRYCARQFAGLDGSGDGDIVDPFIPGGKTALRIEKTGGTIARVYSVFIDGKDDQGDPKKDLPLYPPWDSKE